MLERRVAEEPDRPLVLSGDLTLSYGRAHSQARALAAALHNLGIEAGDRVAIDLPNWPEFVISSLATANLGATIVPLNPGYSPHELQFMLRNSEAAAVIAAERFGGADNLQLFERMQGDLPDLHYVVTVGEEDLWYDDRIFQFEDLISSGEGKPLPDVRVDPDEDPYAILYTAGTTGKPKGVVLTHSNLVSTNAATASALEMGRDDVVLIAVPMFNIFGLGTLVASLSVGASVVLMDTFEADESLRLIERWGVTVVNGVPTMFVLQLREELLEGLDLSSVRTGIVAGAPVSDELVRQARERFVPDLEIAYGMTETSPTVSITRPDDPAEKRNFTVGRLLPGVEAKILGEDGSALPVESIGELAVRGPNVMKGYYRQPEETSRTFTDDGFFRTGDLGMLDEDGYLHVVGRQKDTVLRGGYTIYPREIEVVVNLHPAVEDVVVVGVENEVLGELICACILPVEGAIVTGEEIKDFCKGQIASYKVPDLIRFVDSFPMTGSGKVKRVELARMVSAEQSTHRA
ncbi:MAG: class I adenylate-forming enzyme family protein [Rhodothermales bacterium]|nr:class I adenylate-forming enzyme family protein [Rhodothermales bacterium]